MSVFILEINSNHQLAFKLTICIEFLLMTSFLISIGQCSMKIAERVKSHHPAAIYDSIVIIHANIDKFRKRYTHRKICSWSLDLNSDVTDHVLMQIHQQLQGCDALPVTICLLVDIHDAFGGSIASKVLQSIKFYLADCKVIVLGFLPSCSLFGPSLINLAMTTFYAMRLADAFSLISLDAFIQLLTADNGNVQSASFLEIYNAIAGDIFLLLSKVVVNDMSILYDVLSRGSHNLFDIKTSQWRLLAKNRVGSEYVPLRALITSLHSHHLSALQQGMTDNGHVVNQCALFSVSFDKAKERFIRVMPSLKKQDVITGLEWAAPQVVWKNPVILSEKTTFQFQQSVISTDLSVAAVRSTLAAAQVVDIFADKESLPPEIAVYLGESYLTKGLLLEILHRLRLLLQNQGYDYLYATNESVTLTDINDAVEFMRESLESY